MDFFFLFAVSKEVFMYGCLFLSFECGTMSGSTLLLKNFITEAIKLKCSFALDVCYHSN